MKGTSSRLRDFLSLYDEIQKGRADKPILRFNKPYVGVYWIADQFFCEKQVEISMKMGELETERKKRGKEFHEEISLGMEKATMEQVWNKILSGRNVCVSNLRLAAKWKGIPIIGRADLLCFSESKPLWLFEFKFTSMRIPPDSSHVQARLYSLLLKLMGLDISILRYAIVLAKHKPKNFEKWRKSLIDRVKHHKMLKGKTILKINNCRIFIRKPELNKAESELSFALKYWLGEREAIPTKNPSKCKACKYNAYCDSKPSTKLK